MTLGYDNVGRISTKTEVVAGTSHVFDYTYDLDGQLFDVRKDGILVERYGYDNNANRTSMLTATAAYDAQDRLVQQGGVAYTFDLDGFLTQRGTDTFTYSARGELLSATVGAQTVTYQYDGNGRRVGKTDPAGTTQYLYGNAGSPFQLTASRDAVGVLTTYFYDVGGNLYSFDRGGQRYYVATDQLGTPKVVTDDAGVVVKSVECDAWGVVLSDTNPSIDLAVGFAGGIADGVTGQVRFGWRDYEPGTGRWVARDPILFSGGQANLYVYNANDPPNLLDPAGLDYNDVNVTIPLVGRNFGVTFGMMWTPDGGKYPYVGTAIMSGPGISYSGSKEDPTPGGNVGLQSSVGTPPLVAQVGIDKNGQLFTELGLGTPGWSLSGFYVLDWNAFWKNMMSWLKSKYPCP